MPGQQPPTMRQPPSAITAKLPLSAAIMLRWWLDPAIAAVAAFGGKRVPWCLWLAAKLLRLRQPTTSVGVETFGYLWSWWTGTPIRK